MNNVENFSDVLHLAKNGDISSFVKLGKCYINGEGVDIDYEKAYKWFVKGIEKSEPFCQFELGMMKIKGLGVEKDFLEAKKLLLSSASNGCIDAKYMLSILYFGENSVYFGKNHIFLNKFKHFFFNPNNLKNKDKAIAWLVSASDSGHLDATAKLGALYAEGKELPTDFDKAFFLISKAANLGCESAMVSLSFIFRQGEIDQPVDNAEALKWMTKAANKNNHLAQLYLGGFYMEGEIVDRNLQKAKVWLEKSAENGGYSAYTQLGFMYFRGDFGEKDYLLAEKNLLVSAEKGDMNAQMYLAELYAKTPSIQDVNLAMKWCKSAAEKGNIDAIEKLGFYYWKGIGCESNLDKSIEMYKIAKRKGHPDAALKLEKLEAINKEVNKYMFMKNGKFNLKEVFK
jgi:TPR repeat protein